ncbi:SLC13 family permease [Pseudalkalibacillus caeni]|uniref:SLC13 family permease n=1 Tax=Exobacillus caeni TaxID=2574798 RepID=A0A5R9F2D9_9BACL|nr:SLC13 family permease [Pseudalkalibacillus caeni]TLS37777.1 SLC13 family permease [Pseudalkalibacillus caeni]
MFTFLIKEWLLPEVTMFLTLAAITVFGILTPEEALAGFSNPGVHTVGLLFIIGSAVQQTNIFHRIFDKILGTGESYKHTITRLMGSVMFFSAFMNNTPIVVILISVIKKWAVSRSLSPSKFLIPLSYAAILGGSITLIGTSTNLIVHGLLLDKGLPGFKLLDFVVFGLPLSVAGLIYMLIYGHHRLPNRKMLSDSLKEQEKDYLFEFTVPKSSTLVGKSVSTGGLRHLQDLFLIQIIRNKQTISPASNMDIMKENDKLIFSGNIDSAISIAKKFGLVLEIGSYENLSLYQRDNINLVEAVISGSSSLQDKKVKESNFRRRFNAAIVAIRRNNKNIVSGIGNLRLKPGDTLLLLTGKGFMQGDYSEDFYVVNSITLKQDLPPFKSRIAIYVLVGFILTASFEIFPVSLSAMIGAGIILATNTIKISEAYKALKWNVLILMAISIGIGAAVEKTGLALLISHILVNFNTGILLIAFLFYAITSGLTEIMNNIAAAALMFPVGYSIALQLGYDPKMFAMITAIAASCSFITPIGYQTNLLVYGPGGYRFSDYIKVGTPLSFITMVITVITAILIWS